MSPSAHVRSPYLVIVLVVAAGLCVPLFHVGWFASHEGASYVLRTVEWASGLRRGEIYPRWCPDFYGGYGSPFFVFYAPAVYAAAGGLAASFLDPVVALKVVVTVASLVAGVGAYALAFGETRRADAALLGALLYLAAPYRLADLFVRGDLAEFTALALLPGVLAAYRAAALGYEARRAALAAFGAAILHAAMILSHTLTGLWGTGFVALALAGTAVQLGRRRAWRRLLPLAVAFAAALALSAVYVVPALAYRSFVRVDAMSVGRYDPRNNWIGLAALFSSQMYQAGPVLVAALLATALAAFRHRPSAARAAAWLAVACGLVALALPEASGIWSRWRVPLLLYIQFPWRLLGPASLASATAAAVAWSACVSPRHRARFSLAIAAGGAAVLLLAWPHVSLAGSDAAAIPRDPDALRASVESTTGVDEYLPRTVPAGPTAPRQAMIVEADGVTAGDDWREGTGYELAVIAHRGGAAAHLGLHHFPGWSLETVSGPAAASLRADARGLATVDLPAAGAYLVRLRFGAPWAVRVGGALSLLALLGAYPLLRSLA